MLKPILIATGIAGTLDLLAAFVLSALAGVGPVEVLQFVASGPFGDGALTSPAFAIAGVAVHYGLMACMATAFLLAAVRLPLLRQRAILSGILYGLALWFLMYWIVRPLRWTTLSYPKDPATIAGQLFCHLLLVGIPISLCSRFLPASPRASAARAI